MTGIMQMFVGGAPGGRGSQLYDVPGTYCWVAPAGVTKISVVTIGGAYQVPSSNLSASGGGGLNYGNNISVTPGSSYSLRVGSTTSSCTTARRSCFNGSYIATGAFSTSAGSGLYSGGGGQQGGGGAAGYSGNGGAGSSTCNGSSGSGGGGGGGAGYFYQQTGSVVVPCITCGGCVSVPATVLFSGGGGGGGVGVFGQGSSGAGGTLTSSTSNGGGGGSGGTNGGLTTSQNGGNGGTYGGGGGGANQYLACPLNTFVCCGIRYTDWAVISNGTPGTSGSGAVRIVWPGDTRQFPSTDVGA